VLAPVTLSNGTIPDVGVPMPDSIRRSHQDISRTVRKGDIPKGGKAASEGGGRRKACQLLKRRLEHWSNCKEDKANKFIHSLKGYAVVGVQDDNIAGWKKLWGRKLLETAFGRIKEGIRNLSTSVQVNRYEPTTKGCPLCDKDNIFPLSVRDYLCPCGFYSPNRDVKAGGSIACLALKIKEHPSMECRRLTAEERASAYRTYYPIVFPASASSSSDAVSPDKKPPADAADFSSL